MNVYIFGLGTLGSQVALNLYFTLGDQIKLFATDKDKVERRNMATQIYDQTTIGFSKVDAFGTMIYRMTERWPDNYKGTLQNIKSPVSYDGAKTLVIDAFDNYESRKLIGGENVIHLGFSPNQIASAVWGEKFQAQKSDKDQDDVCDVAEMRYWLHGVAGIMTDTILTWVQAGEKRSVVVDKHFKVMEI